MNNLTNYDLSLLSAALRGFIHKTGETIHFYIAKQLVPEGHKTGRNMAYYGPEHLERLRLVLELKDRLGSPSGAEPGAASSGSHEGPVWQGQVHAALVGLGWPTREADAAVAAVAEDVAPDADVATVLRAALRSLDRA